MLQLCRCRTSMSGTNQVLLFYSEAQKACQFFTALLSNMKSLEVRLKLRPVEQQHPSCHLKTDLKLYF